jgi:Protein of unknown function (DUF1573)
MWYTTPSIRRKVATLAVFMVLPGVCAYLWANYHTGPSLQAASSFDLAGLRVDKSVIDIGTVWSGGQNVQREFVLKNGTGHDIKIESVISDCGCTVATATSEQITNGKSTTIHVVFWPPTVANDQGGQFRRTISLAVSTFNGRQSIPLVLTGFVEPDESLHVFPVNIDLESPIPTTRPSAIVHFKGSAGLLKNIPDKIVISPGLTQRILLPDSPVSVGDLIETKDVQIELTQNPVSQDLESWTSTIVFAPDSSSDGLTLHVRGHAPQAIDVSPQSVILTDSVATRDAMVRLSNKNGLAIAPKPIDTDLPLALEFLPKPVSGDSVLTLHIHLKVPLTQDVSGRIHVQLRTRSGTIESVSIPVVILREGKPS